VHSSFRPQILTRRQVANTCGIGDAPEMLLRTAPHERAPPALRSGSPRPFPSAGHREIVHEMRCRSASTPIGLPRIPLDSSGSISLLRLLVGAGRMADDFRDLSQPRASSRCRGSSLRIVRISSARSVVHGSPRSRQRAWSMPSMPSARTSRLPWMRPSICCGRQSKRDCALTCTRVS